MALKLYQCVKCGNLTTWEDKCPVCWHKHHKKVKVIDTDEKYEEKQ